MSKIRRLLVQAAVAWLVLHVSVIAGTSALFLERGAGLLQDGLPVTHTVAGYELMGLRAGFSGQRWELFGEVRNVFDADYIATLSVLNVAGADARVLYPGAPLSAYTGVRFSF